MRQQYLAQTKLLLEVLPIIRRYPDFALKGGTALNYFLHDLPRLSVDIDLQYLPVAPYKETQEAIHRQMQAMCVDVRQALPGAQCHYDPRHLRIPIRHRHADIKIETNDVIRGQVFEPSVRRLAPRLEKEFDLSVEINCLHKADLYAGKLCAALDRQHPRDLFDIQLLLGESDTFERDIIVAFVVYLVGSKKSIRELLDPNLKDIADTFKQKFEGMATDEIDVERLQVLQTKLPGIIRAGLTDGDKKFLLGFKRGEPDWGLLPIEHASELPAARWKMHNLDRMDGASRQQAIDKLEEVLNRPFIGAGESKKSMTQEQTTPTEQMAEEITTALIEAEVVAASRKDELIKKIVEGEIDAGQWALWVDLANKPKPETSDDV